MLVALAKLLIKWGMVSAKRELKVNKYLTKEGDIWVLSTFYWFYHLYHYQLKKNFRLSFWSFLCFQPFSCRSSYKYVWSWKSPILPNDNQFCKSGEGGGGRLPLSLTLTFFRCDTHLQNGWILDRVLTSAGNLFKFCSRASGEYE